MNTNTNKNILLWVLVIGVLLVLAGGAIAVVMTIKRTSDSAVRAIQPVTDMTSDLGTQVANILHPTPTVIPDPVTVINQVRPLARLEMIQYSVEKVITAEIGQNVLGPLFGDRLLFVGHGYVIAGIDLSKLRADDLSIEEGMLTLHLPKPEIFVATLDNAKSYVYDRETGLLTHGDIHLETTARQAAEEQIKQAAISDGILEQAQENAETYLRSFLESLGHTQVTIIFADS